MSTSRQPLSRLRPIIAVLVALTACAAAAIPSAATAARSKPRVHRVGGHVRHAWPHRGSRAPRTALARWLARQVGAKRAHKPARGRMALAGSGPVALARSYEIPSDDPSYERLLNWSWTYDSAVAAAGFAATADSAQSAQILDQLTALQRTDGAIDIAFNVATGDSEPVLRTGTAAWLGLAAATYDQAFASKRYLEAEQRTAKFLLSLQNSDGLLRGGPDVKWVSTQHNLISYVFLARLGNEEQAAGDAGSASSYWAAAGAIAHGIDSELLIHDASGAHFAQGAGDDLRALDVQALGAMYLQGRGQADLAALVLAGAQTTFALGDQTLLRSSAPATYNMTYPSQRSLSGYLPYAGAGAPKVLWFEGSAEMRLARAALGQDTGALDKSMDQWAHLTPGSAGAPLQANETLTNRDWDIEYHVWPAAAAAGWRMLAQGAPAFFAAPLPAGSTLVNTWTKVRGGNLITTYTDGRVDMVSGGERRVLAGSASASDYSVTAGATLESGDGWGMWVRSTAAPTTTFISGYCIQVDKNFGQVVLRERQDDAEISVPLARTNVPAGFVWYGQPHVLSVTVRGNTLTATIDGTKVLDVNDLSAASATAVSAAAKYGWTAPVTVPTAGSFGLRAWGSALVHFQQVSVGPAL
jgi:hypothetical protein